MLPSSSTESLLGISLSSSSSAVIFVSSSFDTCGWAPLVDMSSRRCATRRLESGLLDVRGGSRLIFIGSWLSSRRVGFAMYRGWVGPTFALLCSGSWPLPAAEGWNRHSGSDLIVIDALLCPITRIKTSGIRSSRLKAEANLHSFSTRLSAFFSFEQLETLLKSSLVSYCDP